MNTASTQPAATLTERLTRPLVRGLRHPVVDNVLRLGAVEDGLRSLHPMWSMTEVRARVLRVLDETADTNTFVLRPNALWRGAQPGQHVQVQVEVNGRRSSRASAQPGVRSRLTILIQTSSSEQFARCE